MMDYQIIPVSYKDKRRDATAGVGPLLLLLVLFLLAGALSSIPWFARDWKAFYYKGALSPSPYELRKVVAPPWAYWALFPIAVLGDDLSSGVLTLVTILVCMGYLRDWRKFALLCLTIPFQATLVFGQTDFLPILGLMVPANLSLLFLTMKPQGALLAALNKRLTGMGLLALLFVFGVSMLLHGWWVPVLLEPPGWDSNWSPWPWSIPVGLALLYWQWKRGFDSDAALCLASLCLAPYFCISSLLPVTVATVKERDLWVAIVIVVLPWLIVLVTGMAT